MYASFLQSICGLLLYVSAFFFTSLSFAVCREVMGRELTSSDACIMDKNGKSFKEAEKRIIQNFHEEMYVMGVFGLLSNSCSSSGVHILRLFFCHREACILAKAKEAGIEHKYK